MDQHNPDATVSKIVVSRSDCTRLMIGRTLIFQLLANCRMRDSPACRPPPRSRYMSCACQSRDHWPPTRGSPHPRVPPGRACRQHVSSGFWLSKGITDQPHTKYPPYRDKIKDTARQRAGFCVLSIAATKGPKSRNTVLEDASCKSRAICFLCLTISSHLPSVQVLLD